MVAKNETAKNAKSGTFEGTRKKKKKKKKKKRKKRKRKSKKTNKKAHDISPDSFFECCTNLASPLSTGAHGAAFAANAVTPIVGAGGQCHSEGKQQHHGYEWEWGLGRGLWRNKSRENKLKETCLDD